MTSQDSEIRAIAEKVGGLDAPWQEPFGHDGNRWWLWRYGEDRLELAPGGGAIRAYPRHRDPHAPLIPKG